MNFKFNFARVSMKFLCILIVLLVGIGCTKEKIEVKPTPAPAPTDTNQFIVNAYKQSLKSDENLIISPYSISEAMAMTAVGASGTTQTQILETLETNLLAGEKWAEKRQSLTQTEGLELQIANKLWLDAQEKFNPEFLNSTQTFFGAKPEKLDFKTKPEPARIKINSWVENITNKKIKDLLPEGSINPSTTAVLTNAIYMYAQWDKPFKKHKTSSGKFFTKKDKPQPADFMQQTEHYPHKNFPLTKVLHIPYRAKGFYFVVALPQTGVPLVDLEEKLSSEMVKKWTSLVRHETVALSLPKFKIESSFELSTALKNMGIKNAFDPSLANFSKMYIEKKGQKKYFHISKVFHKAFIEIDEVGTEAAAATATVMKMGAGPSTPIKFNVNRPFLYLVYHKPSDTILFMGRFTKPT